MDLDDPHNSKTAEFPLTYIFYIICMYIHNQLKRTLFEARPVLEVYKDSHLDFLGNMSPTLPQKSRVLQTKFKKY